MAVDIKAKTEMLDKVVSEFATQLEEYMKTMNSEISSINNAISTLGEGWQGSDYEAFCDTMGERISTITGEMEKCKIHPLFPGLHRNPRSPFNASP